MPAHISAKHSTSELIEDTLAELTPLDAGAVPIVAMTFGKSTDPEHASAPQLSPEQQRKLWCKVDLRILPILSLLYLFCYLDRGTFADLACSTFFGLTREHDREHWCILTLGQ